MAIKQSTRRRVVSAAKERLKTVVTKKNRTLSLNDDVFRQVQQHCADKDYSVSDVVDELLAAFLKD